jgi:hypothetical protein
MLVVVVRRFEVYLAPAVKQLFPGETGPPVCVASLSAFVSG